jgi:hypothetical protein
MKLFNQNILDQDYIEPNLSDKQLLSLQLLNLERGLPVEIQHTVEITLAKRGLQNRQIENFQKESEKKLLAADFFFHKYELAVIIVVAILLNICSPIFLLSIYISVQRTKFGSNRARKLWKNVGLLTATLLLLLFSYLFINQ